MKQFEKEKDIEDGKKYMQWVNEFSDNYNNERYTIYENGGRKGITNELSPFSKKMKQNGNNSTLPEPNSNGYGGKLGLLGKYDQRSYNSIDKSQVNNLINNNIFREKYKNQYVKELNQQIIEKKARKKKELLMD